MSEDIKKPCQYCQGRIDRIKQNHQDKEWMEEIVKEMEKDCLEVREKEFREFVRKKANSRHPHLETYLSSQHSDTVNNTVGIRTCPDCKEYIHSWGFETAGNRIFHKEETHSCNNKNNQERERERERVLADFKKYNIKSIKLEGNKVIIKYNNSQTETKDINDTELQATKSYFQKLGGKNELTLSDLEQKHVPSNFPNSNKGLYIGLAIGGVLIVGIIAWLLMRNKKEKK